MIQMPSVTPSVRRVRLCSELKVLPHCFILGSSAFGDVIEQNAYTVVVAHMCGVYKRSPATLVWSSDIEK